MTKSYTNTFEASSHIESLQLERWKLDRRSGSYRFAEIVAVKPIESFHELSTKLNLAYAMDAKFYGIAMNETTCAILRGQTIRVWFHEDVHESVTTHIKNVQRVKPEAYIKWWYMTEREGPDSLHMPLTGHNPVDEFYPWMPKSIKTFASEFTHSSANVLLLIGPPGTGKTSFIRGLIRHMRYETWVTYDPAIQKNEQFYVQFASLTNEETRPASGETIGAVEDDDDEDLPAPTLRSKGRCLVMEDADELLGKRSDGNDLMKRMLNVSDGLVSLPARKLIFSTNLPGLQSIDDALLRPGRCFGAIKFRYLSRTEAEKACGAIGLSLKSDKDPLTLSEALNGMQAQLEVQTIGFTSKVSGK